MSSANLCLYLSVKSLLYLVYIDTHNLNVKCEIAHLRVKHTFVDASTKCGAWTNPLIRWTSARESELPSREFGVHRNERES
jgi:hypothetical protein